MSLGPHLSGDWRVLQVPGGCQQSPVPGGRKQEILATVAWDREFKHIEHTQQDIHTLHYSTLVSRTWLSLHYVYIEVYQTTPKLVRSHVVSPK